MKYFPSYTRWAIFMFVTLAVVSLAVASTYLIRRLQKQEIDRVEVIATAMKFMQDEQTNDPKTLELILTIMKDNNSIPIILTDQEGNPILAEGTYRNIPSKTLENPEKLKALIKYSYFLSWSLSKFYYELIKIVMKYT